MALHLGVEVVEIVQHERLGKHGQLGRTEIVLAVMADDEVLDQSLEFVGKSGKLRELGLQHFEFDDHVAEQLALSGVGKRTVVGEFVNLADVVQERAGEKQVAIDLRIVAAHQITGAEKRDDVIEQSADVGVVQSFGGRRVAIGVGDLRIGHERLDQRLEMRVLKGCDEARQSLPELVDVFRRLGEIVGRSRFPIRPACAACEW